jgi:hypothetical protein
MGTKDGRRCEFLIVANWSETINVKQHRTKTALLQLERSSEDSSRACTDPDDESRRKGVRMMMSQANPGVNSDHLRINGYY